MKTARHILVNTSVIPVVAMLVLAMPQVGSAKSVWVFTDINIPPTLAPIDKYDIQPAPTYLSYVWTVYMQPRGNGPIDLTGDVASAYLFATMEDSDTLDIVDSSTWLVVGTATAPGASSLAGIVMDQEKQKLYVVDRGTNHLYVYSWDPNTVTLTLDGGTYVALPGCVDAYDLALDEVNDVLYVGDDTTSIKSYNTSGWSFAGSRPVVVDVIDMTAPPGYHFEPLGYGWYRVVVDASAGR